MRNAAVPYRLAQNGTMTASQDLTLFTIGHGPKRFGEIAAPLTVYGVSVIVDVRSVPQSSHAPDFSRDRLLHLAAEANLGYRWLGDRLGGRPSDSSLWRDGEPDWRAIAQSASFEAGITELDGLARAARVALLCAELDPMRCHRTFLIAPELVARNYTVTHILTDGSSRAHEETLFPGR